MAGAGRERGGAAPRVGESPARPGSRAGRGRERGGGLGGEVPRPGAPRPCPLVPAPAACPAPVHCPGRAAPGPRPAPRALRPAPPPALRPLQTARRRSPPGARGPRPGSPRPRRFSAHRPRPPYICAARRAQARGRPDSVPLHTPRMGSSWRAARRRARQGGPCGRGGGSAAQGPGLRTRPCRGSSGADTEPDLGSEVRRPRPRGTPGRR